MTHIDSKKNQYNCVLYFCFAAGYKSQTVLSKKVKLLTKQPQQAQILKCVCSRPVTPGITLGGLYIHLKVNVSVCVSYLPMGTLSTLKWGGEGWVAVRQWDVKLQLSSALQGPTIPLCPAGLPPVHIHIIHNPRRPPLPNPRLLNLLVWLSLPQITCWDSGQGCAWFIKEGGRRGCCGQRGLGKTIRGVRQVVFVARHQHPELQSERSVD